jgi:hypothetical protein
MHSPETANIGLCVRSESSDNNYSRTRNKDVRDFNSGSHPHTGALYLKPGCHWDRQHQIQDYLQQPIRGLALRVRARIVILKVNLKPIVPCISRFKKLIPHFPTTG